MYIFVSEITFYHWLGLSFYCTTTRATGAFMWLQSLCTTHEDSVCMPVQRPVHYNTHTVIMTTMVNSEPQDRWAAEHKPAFALCTFSFLTPAVFFVPQGARFIHSGQDLMKCLLIHLNSFLKNALLISDDQTALMSRTTKIICIVVPESPRSKDLS